VVALPEPVVGAEPGLTLDLAEEPAGELPSIDSAEVTRRLDEIAAQGTLLRESLGEDDGGDAGIEQSEEDSTQA